MAETEQGHEEAHVGEHVHLPDPSPWPFIAGVAGLVFGTALVWWAGDRDNQAAGIALGAGVAALFFAIAGWAWEDSGMLRKSSTAEKTGTRQARFTQVVTFSVPEGKLEEASGGVIAKIEEALNGFRDLDGFLDLRIIATPQDAGPAQVLVETTWSGREEMEGYEASQRSVLDVINDHPDEFVAGSVQTFDMQVVRDTKDVGFRFSLSAASILVGALAIGGATFAAGLSVFQEEGGAEAGGGDGGPPAAFDGTIVARQTSFVTDRFEVPPATEVTLTMDNQDSVAHNIEIFDGALGGAFLTGCSDGCFEPGSANDPVPTEDVTTVIAVGPVQQPFTFTTPADEGEYDFWCIVHSDSMQGTMVVREGAPAPGGGPPQDGGGDGGGGGGETIVAANTSFETTEITAAPSTELTLTLDNQDTLPHNISFYQGEAGTSDSLTGCTEGCADDGVMTEITTGPVMQTFTFTTPADTGDYDFQCDVHPGQMQGVLHIE